MEWINVENKVPEPFTTVLGYCFQEERNRYIGIMEVRFHISTGWRTHYESGDINIRPRVTHWMSLPKDPIDTDRNIPIR